MSRCRASLMLGALMIKRMIKLWNNKVQIICCRMFQFWLIFLILIMISLTIIGFLSSVMILIRNNKVPVLTFRDNWNKNRIKLKMNKWPSEFIISH